MATEFDYTGLNREIDNQYKNIDNAIMMSKQSAMNSAFSNIAPMLSNLYLLFKKRSQYQPIEKVSAKTVGYKPTDVSSLQMSMLDKQVNTAIDASKKYGAFENIPFLISKYADEAAKTQAMQAESAARERQQVIEANNREQARVDQINAEIDQRNWANKMQLNQYNDMLESSALQGISDTIASTTQAYNQSNADIVALNDKRNEFGLWLEQMKFMYPEKTKYVDTTPERLSVTQSLEKDVKEKNQPKTLNFGINKFKTELVNGDKLKGIFESIKSNDNKRDINSYIETEGLFDPNYGYIESDTTEEEPVIENNQQLKPKVSPFEASSSTMPTGEYPDNTNKEFNPFVGNNKNDTKGAKGSFPWMQTGIGAVMAYQTIRHTPQLKGRLNPFAKKYEKIQPEIVTNKTADTPKTTPTNTPEVKPQEPVKVNTPDAKVKSPNVEVETPDPTKVSEPIISELTEEQKIIKRNILQSTRQHEEELKKIRKGSSGENSKKVFGNNRYIERQVSKQMVRKGFSKPFIQKTMRYAGVLFAAGLSLPADVIATVLSPMESGDQYPNNGMTKVSNFALYDKSTEVNIERWRELQRQYDAIKDKKDFDKKYKYDAATNSFVTRIK